MTSNFPLEIHTGCQFLLLPLSMYTSYNDYDIEIFNIIFCCLLLKDFLYQMSYMIAIHHIIALLGCIAYSNTRTDTNTLGIAEFGSGMYNTYLLAKQYNSNVEIAYGLYAITMTMSNTLLIYRIYNHREQRIYITAPFYLLVLTRQYYIYN